MTDKERAFMVGLARLTRETGIAIGGCGCCGSPSLEEVETLNKDAGYCFGADDQVMWVSPDDAHNWSRFGGGVVRESAAE